MNDQLGLNNFFSFLAAMMLAYQPVKSLATINVGVGQGLSAGKRILPIIDTVNKIETNEDKKNLNLKSGTINFKNVKFNYLSNLENKVLEDGIRIQGGEFSKQNSIIKSHQDHRISMSFAIASSRSKYDIKVEDVDNVQTSFPNFVELANRIGMNIEEI